MVEKLSDFNFSGIKATAKDISDLWFNSFPDYVNLGEIDYHYSDPGIDKSKLRLYKKHGWLNDDGSIKSVLYGCYEYGFRTPLINHKCLVVAGCSNTFGTGLNIEQTWGYKLAKKLNLPLVNLGIPGASSDQVYRVLKTFLPSLNPQLVACLMPDASRHEFFFRKWLDSKGNVEEKTKPKSANIDTFNVKKSAPHLNHIKYAQEYMVENCITIEYQLANYNRNIDAIKGIYSNSFFLSSTECMSKNIKGSRARDLQHFGEPWHDIIAEDFFKLVTK